MTITNKDIYIKQEEIHADLKELKDDVKKNTAFRYQLRGIVVGATFVFSCLIGIIGWMGKTIWGFMKGGNV